MSGAPGELGDSQRTTAACTAALRAAHDASAAEQTTRGEMTRGYCRVMRCGPLGSRLPEETLEWAKKAMAELRTLTGQSWGDVSVCHCGHGIDVKSLHKLIDAVFRCCRWGTSRISLQDRKALHPAMQVIGITCAGICVDATDHSDARDAVSKLVSRTGTLAELLEALSCPHFGQRDIAAAAFVKVEDLSPRAASLIDRGWFKEQGRIALREREVIAAAQRAHLRAHLQACRAQEARREQAHQRGVREAMAEARRELASASRTGPA